MFTRKGVKAYIENYKRKWLHYSPYYAQANGLAESTNKVVKMVI